MAYKLYAQWDWVYCNLVIFLTVYSGFDFGEVRCYHPPLPPIDNGGV